MGHSPDNEVVDILAINAAASIAVASGETAWSRSFPLPKNRDFGLEVKFTSSGSVNVQIDLEEGNQAPTTEDAIDATWWVGDAVSAGVTVETPSGLAVAPIVALYGRIKFTGLSGNHASTVCDLLKLVTTEK